MPRHVLCTGGMGYIGSHTIVKLVAAGNRVTIVDNLCNSSTEVLNRLREITKCNDIGFFEADICDEQKMDEIFAAGKFDAVIHFAALKAVGESVELPLKYYRNNVCGTISLLDVMIKHSVKTLVFSSSATVYQESATPLVESDPLGPSNPYGQTKRMMEQILEDVCKTDSTWRVELLRYFNPVGAHPSGLIGEDPQGPPNNLMPYIQQVGVGRRPFLSVFGNDYPTVDGTGVRDYIHVEDLACAHERALEYLFQTPSKGCTVHNLGTGAGYSVLQMVAAFEKASGKKIEWKVAARRPGDLAQVICNPALANKELLGWKAEKDQNAVMEDAWRWQSGNPNGFSKKEQGL